MRNGTTPRKNGAATKRRAATTSRFPPITASPSELRDAVDAVSKVLEDLPPADNAPGAVERMLRANAILRNVPWPAPFDETTHRLRL